LQKQEGEPARRFQFVFSQHKVSSSSEAEGMHVKAKGFKIFWHFAHTGDICTVMRNADSQFELVYSFEEYVALCLAYPKEPPGEKNRRKHAISGAIFQDCHVL
jgi:hypothetical protein